MKKITKVGVVKKTKIVATIGPSSDKVEILKAMLESGMNVARLNFSHGNHAQHKELIRVIRQAAKSVDQNVTIIQDLQGPRIRLGELPKGGVELTNNQLVALISDQYINYRLLVDSSYQVLPTQVNLSKLVRKDQQIYLFDGLIELAVKRVVKDIVYAKVIKGGLVFSYKGINLPQAKWKDQILTTKDRNDAIFGCRQKIDWIALSFVRCAKDIEDLRKFLKTRTKQPPKIMAKIERSEAIKNLGEIIQAADGIMVARGDLGVEMDPAEVPLLQKDIISQCLKAAKPVVVATQMLESMTVSSRPTRAEVSDVANAVIDQADAVMLSAETAHGQHPVESVAIMSRIIQKTEKSVYVEVSHHFSSVEKSNNFEATAEATFSLSKETKAKVIIVLSRSGFSAELIARYRPQIPIIALVADEITRRQINLVWGVTAYQVSVKQSLDALIKQALSLVKKEELAKTGDNVVIVAGQPVGKSPHANLVEVYKV